MSDDDATGTSYLHYIHIDDFISIRIGSQVFQF